MITIKYVEELSQYVAYLDGNPLMKNKVESKLYKKLSIWLNSQDR